MLRKRKWKETFKSPLKINLNLANMRKKNENNVMKTMNKKRVFFFGAQYLSQRIAFHFISSMGYIWKTKVNFCLHRETFQLTFRWTEKEYHLSMQQKKKFNERHHFSFLLGCCCCCCIQLIDLEEKEEEKTFVMNRLNWI